MIVDFRKLTVAHSLQLKFPQSTEDFSCNHNTSLVKKAQQVAYTSLSGETQNHTLVIIVFSLESVRLTCI